MYYEMLKLVRVSESEKSLCSLQVNFPAIALPKERWISIYDCNQNKDYVTIFLKNSESNIGIEEEEVMIVPTFHKEQNFKPSDIL